MKSTYVYDVHTRIFVWAQIRALIVVVTGTVISLSHRRFVFALHQQ